MKDDVMIQFLYLAQKQKGYSELLLRILISCYEKKPQSDILHAICATLMRGTSRAVNILNGIRPVWSRICGLHGYMNII